MSRAYCLTCNEQVHTTVGGTCPLGHPVAAHEDGPEPWVGQAGDEDDLPREVSEDVEMWQVDPEGMAHAHAGASAVNGSVNGHASSFASSWESSSWETPVHEDPVPRDVPAADAHDEGDLDALLAEALRNHPPSDPDDEPAPMSSADWQQPDHAVGWDEPASDDHTWDTATAWDAAPADEAPVTTPAPEHDLSWPADTAPTSEASDDETWGDLASLAAELTLEEGHRADDGPVAASTGEFGSHDVDDVDDLVAELADSDLGGMTDPADPHGDVSEFADAVPSVPEAMPADPEVAPEPETDPEPEVVRVTADAPAEAVDLFNFTAKGRRVGETGAVAKKKTRWWKR